MYERFDSFVGKVVDCTKKGCWVEAEDGSGIVGFCPSGGQIGDRVLYSVLYADRPGTVYLLLDSVLEFAPRERKGAMAA